MICSMTGYGKGEARQGGLAVTVEIKSVNHRFADISVKLPRSFLAHENDLRKRIGQSLKRGKIDAFVNYEVNAEALAVPQMNLELARAYRNLYLAMQEKLGLGGDISVALIAAQKDVVQVREAELDENVLAECLDQALAIALEQLAAMRRAEGEETSRDIELRLEIAEQLLARIVARAPLVPQEWQAKLKERLARLDKGLEWDPQRVAQEVAIFADRCDLSEEIARFRSHLVQFRQLLVDPEPVGRRMDFLVQELNREVNTMGSKSSDAELTGSVVALKAELEKVREQVQNIE
jgi:uncharacterized protein (TIGR00255 family)